MSLLASILLLALTRAEIIERMKAPPITRVEGLVQVFADCPANMRREFQMPVARFTGDICRTLANARTAKIGRFREPGVVVHIGDVRTNLLRTVAARAATRPDGSRFTRLYLPAPGFADLDALRLETVKAFFWAVAGQTLTDADARAAWRATDPSFRQAEQYAEIERWLKGEPTEGDDEACLRLTRKVIAPGRAAPADVLRFSSRLYLYPEVYSSPFCGSIPFCSFREAIALSKRDARLRVIAFSRADDIAVLGAGRGEAMNAAAAAYSSFLLELARGKADDARLNRLLDDADLKLAFAMQEALKRVEGDTNENEKNDH